MKRSITAALCTALALLACKTEAPPLDEDTVRERVRSYLVANAANLLPPERLTPPVLKTYGVLEHEQARFLELYARFRTYQARLPQELQRAEPAIRLTLDLALDDPGDALLGVSEPQRLRADDPAYMAYQLLLGPGVDSTRLADAGYVAQLAGRFGVEARLLRRGLWIALQHDLDGLASSLVGSMERALKPGEALGADRYVDEVLVPFLTFVSRGLTLSEANEAAIAEGFGRALGDRKTFEAAFEELRYHLNGEEAKVTRLAALNAAVAEKKLAFYLLPGLITLQRPIEPRIEVGQRALTAVQAVRGVGLAPRRLPEGCWAYAERELLLPVDGVAATRDAWRALVVHGASPWPVSDALAHLWRELGLDAERVAAVQRGLASKALEGADDGALLAELFFDAVLLQTRCAVDVSGAPGLDGLDRAIAAHAAQVSLARRPELALLDFIAAVQAQRLASSDIDLNARLDGLLRGLFKLATDRDGGALDRAGLQQAVRALHDEHRTARGQRPLPALATFERDLVQARLASAPTPQGL